jgi:hypothetical protein
MRLNDAGDGIFLHVDFYSLDGTFHHVLISFRLCTAAESIMVSTPLMWGCEFADRSRCRLRTLKASRPCWKRRRRPRKSFKRRGNVSYPAPLGLTPPFADGNA